MYKLIWRTFLFTFTQRTPSEFLVRQRVRSNQQGAKLNEQWTESDEQRAKSNEQRVKTSNEGKKEQRAESITSNGQKVISSRY